MKSEQIRKLWKDFWENKLRNHKELKPATLIPEGDKTSLFTVAGMQQLVPYLSGKPHPEGKRLYNIQKCIRTPDIDEIGDERHLTMFEMMGNWSLGDYFKEESIHWSREFLTDYLNIPIKKIGVTVFKGEGNIPEDIQAEQLWKKEGIASKKIKKLGTKDNFWGPAGEIGPCGPCTEMYFDRGDIWGDDDWNLGENDRYIEIWNDVFMEYYKDENGNYIKLSQQNVDTGMGLERITMVMQNVPTIFETDLFEPIIKAIEKNTQIQYPLNKFFRDKIKDQKYTKNEILKLNNLQITKRFRIIADHMRASLFLSADGVLPSNEGRGYVLRRLIRRAFYNLYLLNKNTDYKQTLKDIYKAIEKKYGKIRTNLQNNETITKIIINEMEKFEKTIQKGLKLLKEVIKSTKAISNKVIDGEMVFKLYDTYGFSVELTKEITENEGLEIDIEGFKKYMQQAKEKSKANARDVFKRGIDWAKYLEGIPPTEFVGYNQLELKNFKILKYFEVEGNKIYIFDKTPFYATGGGQTADKGELILDDGTKLKIKDVQKFAGVYLHFIE